MIYSEAERKEIERVYGVFKDYIHASKFLDFVWSEKLGYLLLHIDPTKNTIEEDQIITSADELCAELFNEVATDVFQEAKREHFYPDADDDEIAEIRRRWQPYLDLLPAYRSSYTTVHGRTNGNLLHYRRVRFLHGCGGQWHCLPVRFLLFGRVQTRNDSK